MIIFCFIAEFYSKVTAQKEKNVKVLLALGGWNDSKDDKYSRLVSSPAAREQFIHHALRYLVKYNFDGLSLDWAYPTCPQVRMPDFIFHE